MVSTRKVIIAKARNLLVSYQVLWYAAGWGAFAPVGYATSLCRHMAVENGGVVGIDSSGGEPATDCSKQSESGGVYSQASQSLLEAVF